MEDDRSILELAPLGIFESAPDGRLVSVNPALARIYGFPSPDALLRQLGVPGIPYVASGRREEILRQVEAAGAVHERESEVRRADGRTIWISESLVAIRGAGGRTQRLVGTAHEITSRRRALEVVRLLEEVAVAANSAGTIEQTMQFALDRVCRYMSWPVGHVYV